jgi:oxygen-independent coproporphyrinogen-3 oxidase
LQNTFAARQRVTALYIHVPFCLHKCHYCDFYSIPFEDASLQQWHQGILKEIKLSYIAAVNGAFYTSPLHTIYYGGGTPSLVPPSLLSEQLGLISNTFGIRTDAEITLEANPGLKDISSLRALGINRLSFGLQSTSDHLLRVLGRRTTADACIKDVLRAEKAGIDRIAVDLMIGLPGQTLADLRETLSLVTKLPIGHISYYSLTIAAGTPFALRYGDRPDLLPTEELEREMYDLVLYSLENAGIFPYEISNASRRGEESRHNLVYWQADSYLGLGPAAHSYLGGVRRGNIASLFKWLERVNSLYLTASNITDKSERQSECFFPGTAEEIVDEVAARKETVLLGLRLLSGVSSRNFRKRHCAELTQEFAEQISKLQSRGLLQPEADSIRLTRLGLDLANQVFLEFI